MDSFAPVSASRRPIGFFVHHQGRGHARRCEAILKELPPRPVTIFTADPSIFSDGVSARIVRLPNMIGAPSATPALAAVSPPERLHCVPLGVPQITDTMAAMVAFVAAERPALMVIDVSSEIALLMRLLSVPTLQIRMHGDRSDAFHEIAYDASVGMIAPFDERLEQPDYPKWARARTAYIGGLCTTTDAIPSKAEARRRLGLPSEREVIVTLAGGGGTGTPYAPLTMAARARPETLWLTIGPLHKEGHETDFANLEQRGWVDRPLDYLAAADLVVASAGDNTVHEIARVGRPFLCVPEWRYFGEQHAKAHALERLGAAAVAESWPHSLADWKNALSRAEATDLAVQRSLFAPEAAARAAAFIDDWCTRLWQEPAPLAHHIADPHERADRVVDRALAPAIAAAARAAEAETADGHAL